MSGLVVALAFSAAALVGCGMGTGQADGTAEGAGPTEWRGDYGGPAAETTVVAVDQTQWQALWQALGSPPPALLPDKTVAVGIFLGARNTGGFGIAIESEETSARAHVILYREVSPAPGAIVTQALTNPYLIRLLADPGVPVVIEKLAP